MAGKTNTRKTRRQLRRGFTLVELLTIIGIIVILLMILFPVVSRAIIFAKEVQCRSNLSQMGRGVQSYLADNDGAYPFCYAYGGVSCWTTRIRVYMGYSNDVFWCPIRDEALIWQDINRYDPNAPSGARFANDTEVTRFGYKKDELLLYGPTIAFSYAWNDWGACHYGGPNMGLSGDDWAKRVVTSSMIASPGSMIAIADKGQLPPQENNAYWGFNLDPREYDQRVGSPHNNGANVLWADGHVSWRLANELNMPGLSSTRRYLGYNPNNWNAQERDIAKLWNSNNDYMSRDDRRKAP
jgi:prepilin-type processing-associated H-X9-DG protein